MMGTRSGDLDRVVVTYLARIGGHGPDAIERLVTRESGLLGVSGVGADMRDVLDRTDSSDAREAVDLYCHTARKHLAALTATGEWGRYRCIHRRHRRTRGADPRANLDGLQYLGIDIAPERNVSNAAIISRSHSRVVVRVMETDEDLVIARHVRRLLA